MAAEMPTSAEAAQTFRTPKADPIRGHTELACLVYIYPTGPNIGTRYPLAEEPVYIGRQEDCAVRNTDGSVSRYHARVVRGEDGGYHVEDLGSTNGTFVNNQRRQESTLADGDYLRIGNCIYRYLAGGNIEAEYHEEIYRLTVLDGLTQLHNRRYLTEFLDREVTRSQRHGRPLSLLLFDIDRFKSINDTYGHLGGDMALRELCSRARTVVRKDELLARYGGEEFAVVLPECDEVGARVAGERLREAAAARAFTFGEKTYTLTVSVGGAVSTSAGKLTAAELIARADSHLYQAKAAGRNRVVVG